MSKLRGHPLLIAFLLGLAAALLANYFLDCAGTAAARAWADEIPWLGAYEDLFPARPARIFVHISTVFEPLPLGTDLAYEELYADQCSRIAALHKHAFLGWSFQSSYKSEYIYIPADVPMTLCVPGECLVGREWQGFLDARACIGLVMNSFYDGLPRGLPQATYWRIASDN